MKGLAAARVGGSLNTNRYAAYALYFVKYLEQWRRRHFHLRPLRPERRRILSTSQNMEMTSSNRKSFINSHQATDA
jgi:O-glycosyl hydrolase